MSPSFLSKFTPSLMPKEQLRELFIQREGLVHHIREGLKESVTTGSKHHYLLVGPRGMGKTHLVSMLFYELEEMPEYQKSFLVAWLREEEWGVSSFLDLLIRILRSLAELNNLSQVEEAIEALIDLDKNEAEHAAKMIIEDLLSDKVVIVIAENLNALFEGLGEIGQKRFRSLIQETGKISVLATTPSIFSDVYLQTSPFYGFFETHHLDELSVGDARSLILRVAQMECDEALIAFLNTREGAARMNALYHLAGGNHRVYVILSQFLRGKSLDDLVNPFLEMIDDLTPYYQSQLQNLSLQQRKIVEALCDQGMACPVKELAARCFISPQTASAQLKELREYRFVTSVAVGREQWYELREPLLRICMEVKKQRGKPVRTLIDLLRTWYSTEQLSNLLDVTEPGHQLARNYLQEAKAIKSVHKRSSKSASKAITDLLQTLKQASKTGDEKAALYIFSRLTEVRGSAEDWHAYAYCLGRNGQFLQALSAIERALQLDPNLTEAMDHKLIILMQLGRLQQGLNAAEDWLGQEPENTAALDFKGCFLTQMDKLDDALTVFEELTKKTPNNSQSWIRLAGVLIKLRRFDEALSTLDTAISKDTTNAEAWNFKGYLQGFNRQHEQGLLSFSRGIQLNPNSDSLWVGKCMMLLNLEKYTEALHAAEMAMEIDSTNRAAHFYRVVALFCSREYANYKKELKALIERSKKDQQPVGELGALLRFLLEKHSNISIWKERSTELLTLFADDRMVVQLATGLANTVPVLVSEQISESRAKSWVSMWKELAGHVDYFSTALRFLDVALRYRTTKSLEEDKVLVSEERKLFEMLLQEHSMPHTMLFDSAPSSG